MERQEALTRKIRAVIALVLVALYALGLVAMLTSNVRLGSILWVVSTLGGIGLLYWIHTLNQRRQAPSGEAPSDGDGERG